MVPVIGQKGYLGCFKTLMTKNQCFVRDQIGQKENTTPEILLRYFAEWQRLKQRCKQMIVIDCGHTVNIRHEAVHQGFCLTAHYRERRKWIVKIYLSQ